MSLHAVQTLLERIRPELPEGLALALADPQAEAGTLYPVEEAAVARAVPKRWREFAAGRRAARDAMAQLGLEPQPLPASDDRAPIWPVGLTGSITHTGFAALCVLCRKETALAVGLDLEEDCPLDPALIAEVCPTEDLDPSDPGRQALRIFSAKEAAYKAQYPETRTIFGFDGLQVRPEPDGWRARFTRPVPPFAKGDPLHVRQWSAGGVTLSLCLLPPASDGPSLRAWR